MCVKKPIGCVCEYTHPIGLFICVGLNIYTLIPTLTHPIGSASLENPD